MIDGKRAYISWDRDLALAYARRYASKHDLKHYAHGCYQWLLRNKLLEEAFNRSGGMQADAK